MKVVFPLLNLNMSGGVRIALNLAAGLAARGHEVLLIIPDSTKADYFALPSGMSIKKAKISKHLHQCFGYLATVVALGNAIPDCDFVVAGGWQMVYPGLFKGLFKKRTRVVHLLQHLDSIINMGRFWPIRLRNTILYELIYRLPIKKIVVSSWLQKVVLEKHSQSSICVPNVIDVKAFTCVNTPYWSPPRETYDVLCLARTPKWKGFQDAIKAVRMLAGEDPRVRLIVATQDKLDLPTDFPCQLVRPKDDIQLGKLYQTCSVFLFPSWLEGFGLPPLEAMACGAPVVTTDCGGIRDFAKDEVNCLICPPKDHLGLYKAILRLKQSPELAISLSKNGIQTGQEFSLEKSSEKMENALLKLRA